MSWAARRRFIILFILGAVAVAFLAVVLISTVYKTPTCSDKTQNQGEAGVDCGGPCSYLCTPQVVPPTVLFTKAITNEQGRTDIVASIENKNLTAAAKGVPYNVLIYGPHQALLKTVTGRVDLPPGGKQTVYIPGVLFNNQTVVNSFLEIDPIAPKWFTLTFDPRIVPFVTNVNQTGSLTAPRITATLGNRTVVVQSNVQVVVVVRDARGEVIGASQTVVPSIAAQGDSGATFTWNSAFPGIPAAIEVTPIVGLP
ncbi:MAG: hypothetical protein JWN18_195 [Parcubacteria group bacterium]|nr:hypothetical protein [Parcubacteria group bacterium]